MGKRQISYATHRNWERLKVNPETRLQKRANKTHSCKTFIPLERCSCKETEIFVEYLLDILYANNLKIEDILFSIILNLFSKEEIDKKESCARFIKEYSHCTIINELLTINVPQEYDILGTIYQSCIKEGEKNKNGSYYTTQEIALSMTDVFHLSEDKKFLDPCCGSGAFLLALNNINPNNIFGIDIDPIAVMLAKANLMLKYKQHDFYPNIFLGNFLNESIFSNNWSNKIGEIDFIASNPPWGTLANHSGSPYIVSGERSSHFFVESCSFLNKKGKINFLMPYSILNVKIHRDIREYLLTKGRIERIVIYDTLFTGVTTKYVSILFTKEKPSETVYFHVNGKEEIIPLESFFQTDNYTFTLIEDIDTEIIRKIREKGNLNLQKSKWALGIVTGDNKTKLHKEKLPDDEVIYTGKEINPYILSKPKNYIFFDRDTFQQVARDEFYRASEKLVYRFINKKLIFAYDDTGALFLNSANILIPHIEGMSIKAVMAFLNSPIFQYMYIKLFNEIKILKGNLLKLPFPNISESDNRRITEFVNDILHGDTNVLDELNRWLYNFYAFTEDEIKHIVEVVNGKVNE